MEETRALKGKGCDGWDHRMDENLVHLANCTSGNIFLDIDRKARPSVILGKEGNGVKMTAMTILEETVGGGDQIMVSWFGDIEMSLVIEPFIVEGPTLGS